MITADELIVTCQKKITASGAKIEASDWYDYFLESIRFLRRGRTFPWQKRHLLMEFYTNIFMYPLPDDFDSPVKAHKDIVSKNEDGPWMLYGRDKDFFNNSNYSMGLQWNAENEYLLARQDGYMDMLVDSFGDDLDQYILSGDANTPYRDNVYTKSGDASLRFNITDSSNSSSISRTLAEPIDISSYYKDGSAFVWIYCPTAVTSLTIRLKTDDSNYYEIGPVTANFLGESFSVGWNLIQFKLMDVVETGSPDTLDINSYEITINNAGVTDEGFRLDSLYFRLPSILEFDYNSKYVIKDANGSYKEGIDNGSDIILGDNTFEAVTMWKSIEYAAAFKTKDADTVKMAQKEYALAVVDFNRRYPSTEALLQSNYYKRFNTF